MLLLLNWSSNDDSNDDSIEPDIGKHELTFSVANGYNFILIH